MVREDLLSPEALAELQRAVAEHPAGRASAERQAERTRRMRIAELDTEIENLVRTIAGGVNSPALMQALQRAEAERTMLGSRPRPRSRRQRPRSAPQRSSPRIGASCSNSSACSRRTASAHRLLAEIIGRIAIVQEGERVFADAETDAPARLLVAGASLGVVAGACNFDYRQRLRLA